MNPEAFKRRLNRKTKIEEKFQLIKVYLKETG